MSSKKQRSTATKVSAPVKVIDPQAQQIAERKAQRERLAAQRIAREQADKAAAEQAQSDEALEQALTHIDTDYALDSTLRASYTFTEQQSNTSAEQKQNEQAPAAPAADLKAALAAVVSQFAPAMTEEQKQALLASDAALKAACDAFSALNAEQREHFASVVGLRSKKAAATTTTTRSIAKAAKADVDPAVKALASEVFSVTNPTAAHYALLARAASGELITQHEWWITRDLNPMYIDAKAWYVDANRAKDKRTNPRGQPAIDARNLTQLRAAIEYIQVLSYTSRREARAYLRCAEIAIQAQNARAAAQSEQAPAAEQALAA